MPVRTIPLKVIRKSLDDALDIITLALARAKTTQIEDVLFDTTNYLWKQREECDRQSSGGPTADPARLLA